MKSKLMIEPKLSPAKAFQLRRAIGIQATKKKDYLRTMLSRHQLQAFVRQRGDKINYRDITGPSCTRPALRNLNTERIVSTRNRISQTSCATRKGGSD
jgi:hypothetical protein